MAGVEVVGGVAVGAGVDSANNDTGPQSAARWAAIWALIALIWLIVVFGVLGRGGP